MERILIFGFTGIMIVLIVGFAFVVGALRNLVSVVLLAARSESAESPEDVMMHELAGLSLLRIRGMMDDAEYERRKDELMKRYGK